MQTELGCEGKVRLGSLPAETAERLARFSGDWLEYAPEENAIVVRHVQPTGCPAVAAVPCELISLIDNISSEQRETMPGGALYVRDSRGQTLRVLVEQGEVRIQWPHEDYSHSTRVTLESAAGELNPCEARVNGWAQFSGSAEETRRLQELVDRFEGLYPEGEISSAFEKGTLRVRFRDVNVGPEQLVAKLQELADPPDSLQAELDVGSFQPGIVDHDFRVRIQNGKVQALKPALWGAERDA